MSNENTLENLRQGIETVWLNPSKAPTLPGADIGSLRAIEMKAAQNRLLRFMPYIEKAFPETKPRKGLIESELEALGQMQAYFEKKLPSWQGQLFLKKDSHLPIAGSVKARGGIYEVLKIAEELAIANKLMKPQDNHAIMCEPAFKELFGKYTIQVGSTGNLGLSIGIMSAKLGFQVIVHMSNDAKEWKKELLRKNGVLVKEYAGDYSLAVANGRRLSDADPNSYFIDDENSKDLFLGYSTVAYRLRVQLRKLGIEIDQKHPLFVYIPCGVGGAPGGITYGLKQLFGDAVHCFFVEPTQSPAVILGMASEKYENISAKEIGLSGNTIADGLAVGCPSKLVCEIMKPLLSGALTAQDETMLSYMLRLYELENIFLEPSACTGFHALAMLFESPIMQEYIAKENLSDCMKDATHIVWATGGSFVPKEEQDKLLSSS